MKIDCGTAQDLIGMPEEKFVVAGARMFARAIHKFFVNDSHSCNVKTIINTLHFFADTCPTNEMELFLYDLDDAVRMEKCGKAKTEFRPVKVIPHPSRKAVNPYEFLPDDEQRYRKLCRILLDMLENMAGMMAVMSGRDKADILNQMLADVNDKASGVKCVVGMADDRMVIG